MAATAQLEWETRIGQERNEFVTAYDNLPLIVWYVSIRLTHSCMNWISSQLPLVVMTTIDCDYKDPHFRLELLKAKKFMREWDWDIGSAGMHYALQYILTGVVPFHDDHWWNDDTDYSDSSELPNEFGTNKAGPSKGHPSNLMGTAKGKGKAKGKGIANGKGPITGKGPIVRSNPNSGIGSSSRQNGIVDLAPSSGLSAFLLSTLPTPVVNDFTRGAMNSTTTDGLPLPFPTEWSPPDGYGSRIGPYGATLVPPRVSGKDGYWSGKSSPRDEFRRRRSQKGCYLNKGERKGCVFPPLDPTMLVLDDTPDTWDLLNWAYGPGGPGASPTRTERIRQDTPPPVLDGVTRVTPANPASPVANNTSSLDRAIVPSPRGHFNPLRMDFNNDPPQIGANRQDDRSPMGVLRAVLDAMAQWNSDALPSPRTIDARMKRLEAIPMKVQKAPFQAQGDSVPSANQQPRGSTDLPGSERDRESIKECPLCCNELDKVDKEFFACPCGYQVCVFCMDRIRLDSDGLCPACRQPYDEDQFVVKKQEVNVAPKGSKENEPAAASSSSGQQPNGPTAARSSTGQPPNELAGSIRDRGFPGEDWVLSDSENVSSTPSPLCSENEMGAPRGWRSRMRQRKKDRLELTEEFDVLSSSEVDSSFFYDRNRGVPPPVLSEVYGLTTSKRKSVISRLPLNSMYRTPESTQRGSNNNSGHEESSELRKDIETREGNILPIDEHVSFSSSRESQKSDKDPKGSSRLPEPCRDPPICTSRPELYNSDYWAFGSGYDDEDHDSRGDWSWESDGQDYRQSYETDSRDYCRSEDQRIKNRVTDTNPRGLDSMKFPALGNFKESLSVRPLSRIGSLVIEAGANESHGQVMEGYFSHTGDTDSSCSSSFEYPQFSAPLQQRRGNARSERHQSKGSKKGESKGSKGMAFQRPALYSAGWEIVPDFSVALRPKARIQNVTINPEVTLAADPTEGESDWENIEHPFTLKDRITRQGRGTITKRSQMREKKKWLPVTSPRREEKQKEVKERNRKKVKREKEKIAARKYKQNRDTEPDVSVEAPVLFSDSGDELSSGGIDEEAYERCMAAQVNLLEY